MVFLTSAFGVTPKQFCRVQRFQEVLRRLWKKQQVDWVDIALSCGYYNQAHFINDFKAFSGLNPMAYLTQRGERNPADEAQVLEPIAQKHLNRDAHHGR